MSDVTSLTDLFRMIV